MEEVPPEEKEKVKKSIFDTINQPLSKLFQR
jgi:hypothetical protein